MHSPAAASSAETRALSSALHIPALDGLRALAILLVIPHNEDIFRDATGFLVPISMLAHIGWIGVQLFFVLSGFLITGNLIDSQRAENYYSAFYARRVLRIFPLYYATLIFALFILPQLITLTPGMLASFHNQGWYWTFLANWVEPRGIEVSGFSHFWSLAVEEQFYLLWPLIVHRLTLRQIGILGAALAVAALVIRASFLAAGSVPETAYMYTMCRMDALTLGAAAAAAVRSPTVLPWLRARREQLLWSALGIGLIGAALTHEYEVYHWTTLTYGQSVLSIVFALLILYVSVGSVTEGPRGLVTAILSWAPMRSIGRYSYAMYVLHLPLSLFIANAWFAPLGRLGSVAYVLTIIVLSYMAGALSYHLLEKHFLRLKRYFVPRTPLGATLSSSNATATG